MTRHRRATRLLHMAFAIAIITQLATSLVMVMPRGPFGRPGNVFFQIHQYSGLAALALALAFWMWLLVRTGDTERGALLPWFASGRVRAVAADIRLHLAALRALHWPRHDGHSPLASAVHGLGLLLMSLMAATGGGVYLSLSENSAMSPLGEQLLSVHKLFASLVWVYLIAHASLAVLNQVFGSPVITEMWSLRSDESLSEPAPRG